MALGMRQEAGLVSATNKLKSAPVRPASTRSSTKRLQRTQASTQSGSVYMTPEQHCHRDIQVLKEAAAAAVSMLPSGQRATSQAAQAIKAHAVAMTKEVITNYKVYVSPSIVPFGDVSRSSLSLAHTLITTINRNNYKSELAWTSLHAWLGVPLLLLLLSAGRVNGFGLPIFLNQAKEPFVATLQQYHQLTMQPPGRPGFVGSWEEIFGDDVMQARPAPYPMISTDDLSDMLQNRALLETMLAGFPEGVAYLQRLQAAGLKLQLAGPVTHNEVSWLDVALTNSCLLLGVLYQPSMPLMQYLERLQGIVGGLSESVSQSIPSLASAAKLPTGLPHFAPRTYSWEQVLAGGSSSGGSGGVGGWSSSLTAVGAGDEDGSVGGGDAVMAAGGDRERQAAVVGGAAEPEQRHGGLLRGVLAVAGAVQGAVSGLFAGNQRSQAGFAG